MLVKAQTLPDISVFIITRDDSKYLEKVIRQAKKIAKEVIVLDHGSEDRTLAIAERYADKIYQKQWVGVSRMKALAASLCSHEWVMHLAPNEVLTDSLIDEMHRNFVKQMVRGKVAFKIRRKFYVGNSFVRWGGFSSEKQLRIFKKNLVHFKANSLDESAEIWDAKKKLFLVDSSLVHSFKSALNFYAFESLKDMENYYRFNAELSLKKISYLSALVGSTACFIDRFIFQFGFLDAALGYTVAKIMTMYIWRQYKEGTVLDDW